MRVEEVLTAEFPNFDQNHGIERCIPTKYRGVNSLIKSSFSAYRTEDGTSMGEHALTRSNYAEPFSTYDNNGSTCFRIGSASSYVHGSQTYTLYYTLENVILTPDNANAQELYWDTNGTGWSQRFENLTATVHLRPELIDAFSGETSCYVGAYGIGGTESTSRCKTSISEDKSTITFKTSNLAPRENMTIDLSFAPSTFVVKKSNIFLLIGAGIGALLVLFLLSLHSWISAEKAISEKKHSAKDKIFPTQYTPPKGLSVAEAGTIYLGSTSSLQVASLMELAVKHCIELEKLGKRFLGGNKWSIRVKNIDNIPEEQLVVLKILNGANPVHNGDKIEVKKHRYSYALENLNNRFTTTLKSTVRAKGYFEPKSTKTPEVGKMTLFLFLFIGVSFVLGSLSVSTLTSDISFNIIPYIIPALWLINIINFTIYIWIILDVEKYNKISFEGIKVSKYLDGLKKYMTLAEKERLEFLQSVKGATLSNQNIVQLYEKLLPYAVLFNIESSWLAEMNHYYEMDDVTNPNWLYGAAYLSTKDFNDFSTYTTSSISSSTSSSSSSGSSGGGGGGFSGGGGGGGGGGGW